MCTKENSILLVWLQRFYVAFANNNSFSLFQLIQMDQKSLKNYLVTRNTIHGMKAVTKKSVTMKQHIHWLSSVLVLLMKRNGRNSKKLHQKNQKQESCKLNFDQNLPMITRSISNCFSNFIVNF